MRLLLLLTTCFLGAIVAFGQSTYAKEKIIVKESNYFDGAFAFDYDGRSHKIEFSALEGLFIEFNSTGNELGKGTFYKNDDKFIFVPDEITSESLIQEALQIRIVERSTSGTKIIVQKINSTNGSVINLIKL